MFINITPETLQGPAPVPAAIYRALVSGATVKTSQNGNPMISVELTIQSQGPDESVKTIGRKVFDNWTLIESCLGMINSKFKALTGQDFEQRQYSIDEFANMITSRIQNKECLIQVTVTPGTNGPMNNVKTLSALPQEDGGTKKK
jgi:hypothetical protein